MERKTYLFDAQGQTLGRLAVKIANLVSGRRKVNFTAHIDGGDVAVVINSDQVQVTGNKRTGKMYHSFSGYPGGIKSLTFEEVLARDSRKIIESAVYGMLPKNKLRDKMTTRLRIYKDAKHPHKIDVTVEN